MHTDPTRRAVLGATGGVLGLSGCLGSNRNGSTPSGQTPVDDPLAPPVAGDPEAPVTVAAYEDFACPHCARYERETRPQIAAKYIDPGRIRYVHRDFPIPVNDPESFRAANAARAVQHNAGDETFWTVKHRLFEEQARLGPDRYELIATEVDVDGAAVRTAAVERRYRATIERDRDRGRARGVRGTPAITVNGQVLSTNEFGGISAAIDAALDEGTDSTPTERGRYAAQTR